MSRFRRFAVAFIIVELLLIIIINVYIINNTGALGNGSENRNREYLVDISRMAERLRAGEPADCIDLSEYRGIVSVRKFDPEEHGRYDYSVENINGVLYRFEYIRNDSSARVFIIVDISLGIMFLISLVLIIYLDRKVIRPFYSISHLPTELAKGNLSVPLKEEKSRYFGKFLWGMDMLREKLEDDKTKELDLIKEKKTLILSLSHDVKTPLSAIELYTKALKNGLYESEEKKDEAFEGIVKNTEEIKRYVNEITNASREDFLALTVQNGESYLLEIVKKLQLYYEEKMKQNRTEFKVQKVSNCLIYGDFDRLIEVFQNIIENALKYGDGREIDISFEDEENCRLVTVANSGCSLPEEEIPHVFDSFYRGSNSEGVAGSGLGLYICRELMHRMEGEIFAKTEGERFAVTVVLRKV